MSLPLGPLQHPATGYHRLAIKSSLEGIHKQAKTPRLATLRLASPRLATDNGAMVARAGLFHLEQGRLAGPDVQALANLPFPGLVRDPAPA